MHSLLDIDHHRQLARDRADRLAGSALDPGRRRPAPPGRRPRRRRAVAAAALARLARRLDRDAARRALA
jgi:hypothetical protein